MGVLAHSPLTPLRLLGSRRWSMGCAASLKFSTSSGLSSYEDTIPNLKIGSHSRVLFQGFTGRQATANARESLAWGTRIVGGVKPGVEGEHLGLPVMPSVRSAKEKLQPDVSAIYVPGNQTAQAVEDAIEAEIPLVVAVAEHVPIHDMLRIHAMLKTQSKTRLVGANCPGIISAIGKCRVGFQPLPCFSPGKIGIVAKSGTLSYETVASTTRAGLGQSLCISMGGDVLAGTTFVDALKVFEHDEDTEGIALVGEVGGRAEEDAADWIREYRQRVSNPKPIIALIGGLQAAPGKIMGHAGAWAAPGESDANGKIKILQDAGALIVHHPEKFGEEMKKVLGRSSKKSTPTIASIGSQRRGLHTMRHRPKQMAGAHTGIANQIRSLYIKQTQAFDMLKERRIKTLEKSSTKNAILLAISVDRSTLSPCVIVSTSTKASESFGMSKKFPFEYRKGLSSEAISRIAGYIGISENAHASLSNLLTVL